MQQTQLNANPESRTTAPLKNVALLNRTLEHAMNRPPHLPGMVVFYGPSGYGKSVAAAYASNRHRAYYVQCKSTWTRKALFAALLNEMGIKAAKTLSEMVDQIAEQLAVSGRPLIIDEMDHIVEHKAVEAVRDIYEGSMAPILLIGEEHFPNKLREWERFHNRILDWQPAQPSDIDDCKHLARMYAGEIKIADDLMQKILAASHGAARRICVNIERVRQYALGEGLDIVNAKAWGNLEMWTGEAPARRVI